MLAARHGSPQFVDAFFSAVENLRGSRVLDELLLPTGETTQVWQSPLYNAIRWNPKGYDVVRALVPRWIEPHWAYTRNGETGLHWAAEFGKADIARRLLDVSMNLILYVD